MRKGLAVLGFLVVAGAVSGAWDDGLKAFQKKVGDARKRGAPAQPDALAGAADLI